MLFKNLVLFLLLSALLNTFDVSSSEVKGRFKSFSIKNGLPQNTSKVLLQDSSGFLWIGTAGGLARFDGYNFKVFNSKNSNSISHDNVTSFIEDKSGNFWIGTLGGGLNHFDPKTEVFKHYKYNSENKNSLSHNNVWSIYEDSKGILWVGTLGGGLNSFDPTINQFKSYRYNTNKISSLSNNNVTDIAEDEQGNLWISTFNGLNYLNIEKDEFTRYTHEADDPNSLSNNAIWTILLDSFGDLWVGTNGEGLNLFVPSYNEFKYYRSKKNNIHTLNADTVISFSEDSQGNFWVGTVKGLNYFTSRTEQFDRIPIKLDLTNQLSELEVWEIVPDKLNNLWLGTDKGLIYFNHKTNSFKLYSHNKGTSDSLIMSIVMDDVGNLWLGTETGLKFFNVKTQKYTDYLHSEYSYVQNILKDSSNTLWISGSKGLVSFTPQTGEVEHYYHKKNKIDSLSHNDINDVFEDKRGNIWVGTSGGGVNLFDKKSNTFKHYGIENGLPDNYIYTLQEDNSGCLWVGTDHGLSRLEPENEIFTNYDYSDGLPSIQFVLGKAFKSSKGELYLPFTNGFTRFSPENLVRKSTSNFVVITDILLLNKPVSIDHSVNQLTKLESGYVINEAVHLVKDITLTYEDYLITFEFSTLDFITAKKQKYSYQLEGFDKNWISTDSKNRRATYSNLPSGEYLLKVTTTDSKGSRSKNITSLKITVLPPPWKTWWAYILYILLLFWLVYAVIKNQRNQITFERKLNAELENKIAERTKQIERSNVQLQIANEQLEELSLTDQLTGLSNRRFLIGKIEVDIKLVLRKYRDKAPNENIKEDLIFFMIDIDHFKQVNDIYGHTAGDAVLIQIKSILEKVFRKSDYMIRWGGEEFLVISRFTSRDNAPLLAERLRYYIESHNFDISSDITLKKTCSIGFSSFPFSKITENALEWERIVDIADHCLYAAKKSSRNAWVGLNASNSIDGNFFSEVIDNTQKLIETKELQVITSISDVSDLIWH